ncbi:MAG: diguanylate cyclase, partial [Caldilineaceae bacterium]|nr:diguanylate cyclase [Caldilineaceae bacterium]
MNFQPKHQQAIRLLLIEDNPGDQRLLHEHLQAVKNYRFSIASAGSLDEALGLLDQNPFDLILLDLTLPDSQGIATLTKVMSREHPLPVVVLTGISNETTAMEAVRVGAQDYLVKSQVTRQALLKSILYALERFQAMEALRESEERYALAALAASDGLWDWDLRQDNIFYSSRWCLMIGHGEAEISASPREWLDRVHPDDLPLLEQAIQHHLHGNNHHFEIEYRMRHRNGNYHWMLSRGAALFDRQNKPYRMAGSQSDITAAKQTEQRLIYEVQHDPLTRLPNRVLFRQRLQEALSRFKMGKLAGFAVLFIDLDRFKTVNDSLGHMAGDQLLNAIARRLENCVSPDTTIARLGGDEFAVLLDSISVPADALRVAKRMLSALEHPFHIQSHDIFTSGCIGIALSNELYTDPEELLRDADTAMYRAKAAGMGQYQVFDSAMHTRAVALLRLETDLRRAIERQEFSIHYQPIVSFHTGRLAGFEALVRWNHPERGLLFPSDFLAVADETGLLATIDRWMIRTGTRQLKRWQEEYPNNYSLFLSLNLSDRLINQQDLPALMEEVIADSGVDPRTLKLEITETVINTEINHLRKTLARLRDMQIQLCLDDFGTGYSSLGSLQ